MPQAQAVLQALRARPEDHVLGCVHPRLLGAAVHRPQGRSALLSLQLHPLGHLRDLRRRPLHPLPRRFRGHAVLEPRAHPAGQDGLHLRLLQHPAPGRAGHPLLRQVHKRPLREKARPPPPSSSRPPRSSRQDGPGRLQVPQGLAPAALGRRGHQGHRRHGGERLPVLRQRLELHGGVRAPALPLFVEGDAGSARPPALHPARAAAGVQAGPSPQYALLPPRHVVVQHPVPPVQVRQAGARQERQQPRLAVAIVIFSRIIGGCKEHRQACPQSLVIIILVIVVCIRRHHPRCHSQHALQFPFLFIRFLVVLIVVIR
mmetsp:Transcript_15240/g.42975  ORF Transcript_15240/g.42975 Transcript_15240/m.42975 type:complete len:316 (-) Transcript_15240:834-1781(-)